VPTVHLHLHGHLQKLAGEWHWEGHGTALWCSDVMAFPETFEGTKGLLHPDDVKQVTATLEQYEDSGSFELSFRIITTWGIVQTVTGTGLRREEPDAEALLPDPERSRLHEEECLALAKGSLRSFQQRAASDLAERLSGSASWYINAVTHESYYSDNCYRLHGLQPQSINVHSRTFLTFVHPDDADIIEDAFDKAWQRRLPVEVTYRIIAAGGEQRIIRCSTSWTFSPQGHEVLLGTLYDETTAQETSEQLEGAQATLRALQESQRLSEQQCGSATWQFNLLTRQWRFSDQYYRLHGVRQQEVLASADMALQFVHPDDRGRVTEAFARMESAHECPELEYRILRPDGKMRYLQVRGRTVLHRRTELLIVGAVRDITIHRSFEKREARMRDQLLLREETARMAEELGGLCTWTWDLRRNESHWSEGCFSLLGFKPNNLELTLKLFTSYVHADDRKAFTDTIHAVAQTGTRTDMKLRLEVKGELRRVQVRFQVVNGERGSFLVAAFRDESNERLLLTQKTREAELFDALLAALPEMLMMTDLQNRVLRSNKALQDWLPRDNSNLDGSNLFESFPGLKEGEFPAALQRALGGETVQLSTRLFRQRRAVLHTLMPVRSEGELWAVLHLVRERPQQNDLQEQVLVQEHLVEILAEASTARIMVLDRHLNYRYWNSACEAAYGLRSEEVIGRNLLEVAPGFYDEPSYLEFRRALKGETVTLSAGRQEAGKTASRLLPVSDSEGHVACIIWIAPVDEPALPLGTHSPD
jgi:PAS domain S-box-containing protein